MEIEMMKVIKSYVHTVRKEQGERERELTCSNPPSSSIVSVDEFIGYSNSLWPDKRARDLTN